MPCFFNGCKKKSYCANHSSDNHIRHPVDRYQCSVFVPYFDLNDVGTFPLMDKSTLSDDISSLCLFHMVSIHLDTEYVETVFGRNRHRTLCFSDDITPDSSFVYALYFPTTTLILPSLRSPSYS